MNNRHRCSNIYQEKKKPLDWCSISFCRYLVFSYFVLFCFDARSIYYYLYDVYYLLIWTTK